MEADRFAVANAQNKLDVADGKLSVLQNLTKAKMLVQYDSDIEAAEASRSAAESELMEERSGAGGDSAADREVRDYSLLPMAWWFTRTVTAAVVGVLSSWSKQVRMFESDRKSFVFQILP